eukprot:1063074-Rhodomonas_salina.2
MSGTETAYGAVCLRACYAMSGTETCYQAREPATEPGGSPGWPVAPYAMVLCACYGWTTGTDVLVSS